MWVKDVIGTDLLTYQVLSLKNERCDTEIGYPMLPRIPVKLSVPTNCTIDVTVNSISQITLYSYNTAPFPEVIPDPEEGDIFLYTPDPSIYNQSALYPDSPWLNYSQSMFRDQEIVATDISPESIELAEKHFNGSTTWICHSRNADNIYWEDKIVPNGFFKSLLIFLSCFKISLENIKILQ